MENPRFRNILHFKFSSDHSSVFSRNILGKFQYLKRNFSSFILEEKQFEKTVFVPYQYNGIKSYQTFLRSLFFHHFLVFELEKKNAFTFSYLVWN